MCGKTKCGPCVICPEDKRWHANERLTHLNSEEIKREILKKKPDIENLDVFVMRANSIMLVRQKLNTPKKKDKVLSANTCFFWQT